MPYNFTGVTVNYHAKLGVVSDGEVCTTDGYGQVVTRKLSPYTAFAANPVRASTGLWSVTMKDSAVRVLDYDVRTLLTTGNYLGTQLKPTTKDANGRLVLNWVFNSAGTPTDLPANGQFIVYVKYSEVNV